MLPGRGREPIPPAAVAVPAAVIVPAAATVPGGIVRGRVRGRR